MIKFNECNQRQKKAFNNFKWAAIDYIFGLQNGCFDSEKGSAEYQNYYMELQDLTSLIDTVYKAAINSIYSEGFSGGGKAAETFLKDIRFCGKEFLMQLAKQFCMKYQKEALAGLD